VLPPKRKRDREIMIVLSLFDGMSCGRLALERAGIEVENYYASEIDKYAVTVSKKNWPDIIQIGDVTQVSYKDGVLHTQFGSYQTEIDMVIGGSPCQSFSVAGNQEGFDGKSGLFYEWLRILREVSPKYFLLENVCMKKEWENEITQEVGVAPIMINSALVSAQNRKRLYWTNIEGITQPQDSGITLPDILECDVVQLKQLARGFNKGCVDRVVEKSPTLSISSWQHNNFFKCINTHETNKTVTKANKAYCLTANYNSAVAWNSIERKQRSMVVIGESDADGANIYGGKEYRKLTPIECERLQTLPDDYTKSVSNNQRYKMIGNGWTVDVIAHIFSFIKQEKQND
jgi:DNA (cytosine-5)-methyltransferase 3A